ncbi:MAG: DNA translocase FtsK, partial [Leadbetterella sp.]|nr:DNA translocase FtsK [Leadbetterella sp.]
MWFGISSFLVILPLFLTGFRLVFNEDLFKLNLYRVVIGCLFYMFFFSLLLGYFVHIFDLNTITLSGRVGLHANELLHGLMGYGSLLLTLLLLVAWMIFFHGFTRIDDYLLGSYLPKKRKSQRPWEETAEEEEVPEKDMLQKEPQKEESVVSQGIPKEELFEPSSLPKEPFKGPDVAFTIEAPEPPKTEELPFSADKNDDLVAEYGEYDPKLDLSTYQYPPLSLLAEYGNAGS